MDKEIKIMLFVIAAIAICLTPAIIGVACSSSETNKQIEPDPMPYVEYPADISSFEKKKFCKSSTDPKKPGTYCCDYIVNDGTKYCIEKYSFTPAKEKHCYPMNQIIYVNNSPIIINHIICE